MKSRSLLGVLVLALALVATGIVYMLIIRSSNTSTGREGTSQSPSEKSSPVVSERLGEGDLNVQISLNKPHYVLGETLEFTSTIENISDTKQTYTFGSSCTEGDLYIDNQHQNTQICLTVVTGVPLSPGQKQTYDYRYTLASQGTDDPLADELYLAPGTHTAYLDWQGVVSRPIEFEVTE